jgi:glycine oxidase
LVLCTGASLPSWGGPAIVPVRGQMVALEPTTPPLIDVPVRIRNRQYGNAYIVPKADRWILGSTSEEMGYDARPTAGGLLDILNKCYAAVPALYDQPVLEVWAGLRPATASRRPVVDALEADRVWVFNGLYRHGILLAPWLAEQLADWIAGGRRPEGVEPFSL